MALAPVLSEDVHLSADMRVTALKEGLHRIEHGGGAGPPPPTPSTRWGRRRVLTPPPAQVRAALLVLVSGYCAHDPGIRVLEGDPLLDAPHVALARPGGELL